MVYRIGFWTVVVVAGFFLVRWIWAQWLRDLYFTKVYPTFEQGVAYVKQAADWILLWSGVQQRSWLGFVFDDSYILIFLAAFILLLLGICLCVRLWRWEDMAAGFTGLFMLVLMLWAVWSVLSRLVPYLTYSPVWSCALGAFILIIISLVSVRLFLNRPLQPAESLRIVFNALVFSVAIFVVMLGAAWAWLTLLKFFTVSPKRATISVLLFAVFLLLVARMARLRRELKRSSIERMGDLFYG